MQKPQKPPSFHYQKGKPVPDEVAAKAREIAQSRSKTSISITPKQPIDIVNIEDIKVGKLLGTGSYSSAYEIEKCESHRILKKLRSQVQQNPLLFAACAADLVQEGRILASMSSSNIINIHAWSGPNMMDTYLQGNPESCYLVLEQLYGTLEDKLKIWQAQSNSLWYMIYEETTTPEYLQVLQEKCQHILNLVKALEHLHQQHCVLHRDLKPGMY
jgi:serine/threonine protein kinase